LENVIFNAHQCPTIACLTTELTGVESSVASGVRMINDLSSLQSLTSDERYM